MNTRYLLTTVLLFSSIDFILATVYTCNSTISCGCSVSSTTVTSRIIGGEAAMNYTWGWMASLQLNHTHVCGASLISSEYAVTGARCVITLLDKISLLIIRVGTNDLNDTSSTTIQQRAILRIVIHPNYNSIAKTNDIALVQFVPLLISSNFKLAFICLPNENQDPFGPNTSLVGIGWGVTTYFNNDLSNYLQQVTLQTYSSTSIDCLNAGLNNSTVQFCAGNGINGKNTCQGDSGGPLMAFVNDHWILAGIIPYDSTCTRTSYPSIYTRVSAFITFINSIINTTESSTIPSNKSNIIVNSKLIFIFFLFLLI